MRLIGTCPVRSRLLRKEVVANVVWVQVAWLLELVRAGEERIAIRVRDTERGGNARQVAPELLACLLRKGPEASWAAPSPRERRRCCGASKRDDSVVGNVPPVCRCSPIRGLRQWNKGAVYRPAGGASAAGRLVRGNQYQPKGVKHPDVAQGVTAIFYNDVRVEG